MKLIDRAIGVLRDSGWTRGALMDDQGRVCLLGALQVACQNGDLAYTDYAVDTVYEVIRQQYPDSEWESIEDWNDEGATDVDEVIGVLKLTNERLALIAERNGWTWN